MKAVLKHVAIVLILILATPCFAIYVWMQTVLDGSVAMLKWLNNDDDNYNINL